MNYSDYEEEKLLQLVGSIESKSTHPISLAFKEYLEDKKIDILDVKEFQDRSGYGIVGKIEDQELILGNYKILELYNIENKYKEEERELAVTERGEGGFGHTGK